MRGSQLRRLGTPGILGLLAALTSLGVGGAGAAGGAAQVAPALNTLPPQLVALPRIPGVIAQTPGRYTYCTLPDGTLVNFFHCYTPQDIREAYGVSLLKLAQSEEGHIHNYGQGQTIVLVDAYGSPTAAADLQHFHDTFFSNLPEPNFQQIFPQGNPQYHNVSHGNGLSGSNGAAGWSGEATLDIEWAYSIAPLAHIVLLAVPPAETEGVQGFPNLFKAIAGEIQATPPGTVFSMSFAATEQTLEAAGPALVSRLDQVFQMGLARHDNFFAAAGDTGTVNSSKLARESVSYPYPTVSWPASSPYVVAVGGTQLQYGWKWDPFSNEAFTSTGAFNGAYWNSKSTPGSNVQAVWNESWAPVATGGGVSTLYPRPSWQQGIDQQYGDHRMLPDTSWNAAVNGGVDVYITAYPEYNCGNTTGCWTVFGGTSAATPQTAALVALLNADLASRGDGPIGFLDPLLYGLSSSSYKKAYTDIVPEEFGRAQRVFAGSEVGVPGPVYKSVGNLQDNQLWEVNVPGYPTTAGYDPTTGWGAPWAPGFVNALEESQLGH